jgi:hypothetical protein
VLGAAAIVLAGVVAWNVFYFTRPADVFSATEIQANLAFSVVTTVSTLEAYRNRLGHLPPSLADTDLGADWGVEYELQGEDYRLTASILDEVLRYAPGDDLAALRTAAGLDPGGFR